MNIILWIIFGALVGWVANMLSRSRGGCLTNVIVGVVGAFLGGTIVELITGGDFIYRFNLVSFIVAVIGAVILLAILRAVRPGPA